MANNIAVSGKKSATFVVDNLNSAEGFGLHVSTIKGTDGYGGRNAEFHFRSGTTEKPSNEVVFQCYDGFKDANLHTNEFRVDLGPKEQICQALVEISERRVTLSVARTSKPKPGSNEEHVYDIVACIPLREETGFWQTGELFWNENGVLNGRSGREGHNYQVTNPIVR